MRAYVAILKDSFREALASRVLWIILLLGTALLLALAPFGLTEQAGALLNEGDLLDAPGLISRLNRQQSQDKPSPGKQVYELFGAEFRKQLSPSPTGKASDVSESELRVELNRVLGERGLYDADSWKGVHLGKEARELVDKLKKSGPQSLAESETPRLNRLLLEAAYPRQIARSRDHEFSVSYLVWHVGGPFPGRVKTVVDGNLIAFVNLVVGFVGVLAGVLVTASIVPHTYEPGAIDLLLSKPISRSLLYVTKFLGGCAFMLVNALYIIGGLWLLAGLRFGVWNEKLPLCIPLFMFLFAIYYSVSALTGVIWKNAIVCVVVTVLFWGVCFGVGTAKGVVDLLLLNPRRITRLIEAGDALAAVDEQSRILIWEPSQQAWQEAMVTQQRNQPPGFVLPFSTGAPVYDKAHGELVAMPRQYPAQFGMQQSGGLSVGKRAEQWKYRAGVPLPAGATDIFINPQSEILAASPRGLQRLTGSAVAEAKPEKLPATRNKSPFQPVTDDMRLRTPLSAAMDAATGAVALFDRQYLRVFRRTGEGRYTQNRQLELNSDEAGQLAIGGQTVLLALADGRIQVYNLSDLSLRQEYRPEKRNRPRFVECSPDGRWFAVLFHHRRLWMYDAERLGPVEPPLRGQGDLSAVGFSAGQILVADKFTRVTRYSLDAWQEVDRMTPRNDLTASIYFFGLKPLHAIFPKPGELDNVTAYLLTDEATVDLSGDNASQDLRRARVPLDIWGPIRDNLIFIAVMVGLGCLYTRRKDF